MMLFPAVLIVNFPNSEVCLIGEWSINGFYYIGLYYIMAYIILVWLIYRLVFYNGLYYSTHSRRICLIANSVLRTSSAISSYTTRVRRITVKYKEQCLFVNNVWIIYKSSTDYLTSIILHINNEKMKCFRRK